MYIQFYSFSTKLTNFNEILFGDCGVEMILLYKVCCYLNNWYIYANIFRLGRVSF